MATAQAPAGVQSQQVPFSLNEFLKRTQPNINPMYAQSAWTDGGNQVFNLPLAGLGSCMMLRVTASITVAGTVTGGTFANLPYPAPFSILKGVTLSSNANLSIINLTGYDLYTWLRERYGLDMFSTTASAAFMSSNNVSALGFGTPSIVPGAAITAQTYNVTFTVPIPIAYNRKGAAALLFLQSKTIQYQLGIAYGQITGGISATGGSNDLFAGLTGTGLSVTASVSATCEIETLLIPSNYAPPTSYFMSVISTVYSPLIPGFNPINIPSNDEITMLIAQLYNNSAAVSYANVSGVILSYALNKQKYNQIVPNKQGWDYWLKGLVPQDGTYTFDEGIRNGLKTQRDTFDSIQDNIVTGLQLQFQVNPSLSVTGNSGIRLITESLRYFNQNQ